MLSMVDAVNYLILCKRIDELYRSVEFFQTIMTKNLAVYLVKCVKNPIISLRKKLLVG